LIAAFCLSSLGKSGNGLVGFVVQVYYISVAIYIRSGISFIH
jgi:hypothetical protein